MISRIVFSGSGGQGIITAAILFAEAAVYYEELEATQTQSYGPEARGGSARSDVIIASNPIGFPKVIEPNILVALSQEAYDKYAWIVRPGGVILIDSYGVKSRKTTHARQAEMDFTRAVLKQLNTSIGVNIAVIGALAGIVNFMRIESLQKVVEQRFDERYRDTNIRALFLGYELAKIQSEKRNFIFF